MDELKETILTVVRQSPGITEEHVIRNLSSSPDPLEVERKRAEVSKAIASLWVTNHIVIRAHCVYLEQQ